MKFIEKKDGLKQHVGIIKKSENEIRNQVIKFEKLWQKEIEFNPSASVVGSIASQEIIKCITVRDMPEHGFYLYDSDS